MTLCFSITSPSHRFYVLFPFSVQHWSHQECWTDLWIFKLIFQHYHTFFFSSPAENFSIDFSTASPFAFACFLLFRYSIQLCIHSFATSFQSRPKLISISLFFQIMSSLYPVINMTSLIPDFFVYHAPGVFFVSVLFAWPIFHLCREADWECGCQYFSCMWTIYRSCHILDNI